MTAENEGNLAEQREREALAATAQDLFKHVMRDLVGPGLRVMGFRGGYTRGFWIERGDYSSGLWTQKNRHSTKTEVDFWIHLSAACTPTSSVYWSKELHWLIPGMTAGGWTIEVGSPPEPVAESVLDGIRRYGLPAMQAAIDSPGFPPGPRADWARTFARAGDNDLCYGPPALDEIAWVLRPTGQPADEWFAMLADESAAGRMDGLRMMAEEAADDPRCRAVLVDRLERDPSHRVRMYAADLLAPRAADKSIRQALQDAAALDEDLQVRLAARYALRLTAAESA